MTPECVSLVGRVAPTRRNGDITCGGLGQTALPGRKRMDHRGPLSIDVTGAWYFITICAEGHLPWQIDAEKLNGDGRAVCPKPPLSVIAPLILREARENHRRGIWKLALMLVMPDHLHFIAHICLNAGGGGLGQTRPTACRRSIQMAACHRVRQDFRRGTSASQ